MGSWSTVSVNQGSPIAANSVSSCSRGITNSDIPWSDIPLSGDFKLIVRPTKPNKGDSLDKWLAYYHEGEKLKYTLDDLADDSGYSPGYVRIQNANYVAQHGKMTKRKRKQKT